jgi:hypothetical protein
MSLHRQWFTLLSLVIFFAVLPAVAPAAGPEEAGREGEDPHRFEIEFEGGAAWQSRNDVEIPNDGTATRFSLKDLVGTGPLPAGRFYFTWNIKGRHGVRVLLAPLSYTESGTFTDPVIFVGETYAAGTPTEATYQFNSWRATYRYQFWQGKKWDWWVGFTAKVRDAKIQLRQGDTTSKDTDLGFVPLLYLRGDYQFSKQWHFLFEMDALAGGPGRAEDVSLRLGRDLGEHWSINFGYRTVEGGADVDAVYNFAWFNYAVVSGVYRW